MLGLNKVMLLGRLGKDPELKNAGGIDICNFSVATSKTWKDEAGEKQEKTQWTDVVAFRKLAEIAGKYLAKGRQVYVEGELSTRTYEKDGVKKWRTEVIAQNILFVGDKPEGQAVADGGNQQHDPGPTDADEIPF